MNRRLDIGALLAAAGALLLLVSLFLEWFEEDLNAWKVYEVLDLVLAGLALAALAGAAARLGARAAGELDRLLLPAALSALVIVVAQLVNHPPAAIERGNELGLYLAIAGAVMMAAGASAGVARISVAVDVGRRAAPDPDAPTAVEGAEPAPADRGGPAPPADPAAVPPPREGA